MSKKKFGLEKKRVKITVGEFFFVFSNYFSFPAFPRFRVLQSKNKIIENISVVGKKYRILKKVEKCRTKIERENFSEKAKIFFLRQ